MSESSFDVQLTRSASKDLRKFRQWSEQINQALSSLSTQPLSGELLSGSLDGVRSLHIRLRGSGEARVAYIMHADLQIVLVIAVGMRENFYDLAARRAASQDF